MLSDLFKPKATIDSGQNIDAKNDIEKTTSFSTDELENLPATKKEGKNINDLSQALSDITDEINKMKATGIPVDNYQRIDKIQSAVLAAKSIFL